MKMYNSVQALLIRKALSGCNMGQSFIYPNVCYDLFTCHHVSHFISLTAMSTQSARESAEVQGELSEKVDRLKAELVVFKSLMSDVSICSG